MMRNGQTVANESLPTGHEQLAAPPRAAREVY